MLPKAPFTAVNALISVLDFRIPGFQVYPTFFKVGFYHMTFATILTDRHNEFWRNSISSENSVIGDSVSCFISVLIIRPMTLRKAFGFHKMNSNHFLSVNEVPRIFCCLSIANRLHFLFAGAVLNIFSGH